VRFLSLLVFDVVVLLIIGWLTPARVGWAALWAGVILTALTIWIKPLIHRMFQSMASRSAGQRTKIGEKLVQGALVFLVALIVFGRRAEKAAYAQVEGQVGAAAGALGMLKRGWKVDQAVAFNKSQDVVHRVVGPPGIVLVGEGNPGRVRNLLTNERKKTARIVGEEVPITLIVVGKDTEKGEVPLPKLVNKLRKTKRVLKPAQITPILNKLKALDAMRPQAPLPRGPVPSSAKGARRMMQGR
jgi:hypothetical protein